MRFPIPTTILALAVLAGGGCGASASEVYKAKTSAYDADFAVVFSHTLNAVRELYPHYVENPSAGWIKTSWHPLRVSQAGSDPGTYQQVQDPNDPMGTNYVQSGPSKRYYIRFRVYVIGGRPWRVRVEGEASLWEAGAVPTPLKGAETPHWLKGRTEALQVAIYRKLKKYAVPIADVKAAREDEPPPPVEHDEREFGELPAGATDVIRKVRDAAQAGDFPGLRAHMVDDFTWSAGAAPSADTAIVMLQADPTLLAALVNVINDGCGVDADGATVMCPANPAPTGYRAGFAQVGGVWKLTFFVGAD